MSDSEVQGSPGSLPLIVLAAALLLIYLLWSVLFVFILAALFAFIINPIVKFFDRRLPHLLSIIFVYLAILLIITGVIGLLYPTVADQANQFVSNVPSYARRSKELSEDFRRTITIPSPWRYATDRVLAQLGESGLRLIQEAIPVAISFLSSLAGLILIPLLAFFMLLDCSGYRRMLMALLPARNRDTAADLLNCVGSVLWNFFKAELVLMSVVGLLDGIGLFIVGMPYAAVFAIIAGVLEVIPSFGPALTTIGVAVVAVLIDPVLALKGAIVTTAVQLLENAFLVPVVMGKTVGLNPITVAFSIFLGGKAAGIPGAVIGIPLAMIAKIVIFYFYAGKDSLPGRAKI
jgi:predicted PurR-regulated permease PerM